MSEYKPNPSNPIFGEKGYHSGDTAEDLPGTALQREREEREKARAAREELRKQAAEEKKLSEEEEKSYINGDFQTLLGYGGNKVQPNKRLLSDAERTAASIPESHPMEENAEYWATQSKITRPEPAAKEVVIPESDPWAMSPAELEAQVEGQVDTLPEDTLVRQVATAAPKLTPEQNKQVVEELQRPENKAGIIKRMKDKIGAFVAGGTGGYASSMVARVFISTGIRSVFGTTLGVGIAAGAIAGGSVEGVKSYLKERNKFSADDIMTRLDSSKSDVESAVVISEANKALQEARISHPERVPALTQKIQEAQVVLEAKIKSPEFKNESEKNKIAFILKTSETARDNINREQKKEIKALIEEIKFKTEKSEVNWNKVMKSTGKGALVGALGGTLGGLASGWIAEHLGHSVDDLAAIHAGHVGQAYSSAIEGGRDHALNGDYVEHVLAGDKGLTEEARNAIHDYMINLHSLGAGQVPDMTTAKYIYAEDWLVKNVLDHGSTVLHPGEVVSVSGANIQLALEHAQNLSTDQLNNLTELISHQPHLISQHTEDWLNNFDYANPENGQMAASLLQEAGNSVEYTINNPALMEAAAWASGALPEASYQMGREAAHFVWHMAGRDADAEARGIKDLKTGAVKTSAVEGGAVNTETPGVAAARVEAAPAVAEAAAEGKTAEQSKAELNAETLKTLELYKDLKIRTPRNLSNAESAALGVDLLKVLSSDQTFNGKEYNQIFKKAKFSIGVASSRNKEGVMARKTGLFMYIDIKKELTSEQASALMNSLREKLVAIADKETPASASAASVEGSPENSAEKLESLPKPGSTISVKRENGEVEDGWLVWSIDSSNKNITAIKPSTGKEKVSIDISFEDYRNLNKPENKAAGAGATEPENQTQETQAEETVEQETAGTQAATDEAETPATNRIMGNPNIRAGNLSVRERRNLETNQRTISRMDLNWPQDINDQSRDNFDQELISIVEKIRAERNDLLPYFTGIKLDLAEDSNNLQTADIKLNPNGRYNINIQAPQSTIYAELLPILEDLQRTAKPT
jgi:hypothetical protein